MNQLQITRTGPPAEVVELISQARPNPAPNQVLVRMLVAAINPADLNFIEGTYGTSPALPCAPGMEGVGVVAELGSAVSSPPVGTLVLPLESPGAWAEWRLLAPHQLHPLPASLDLAQAALLRVNPVTAWGLLHQAGPPAAGSWIAQNAASSAAGHAVVQIANSLGLHTVNFVRRAESIPVCQALGADLVFLDDSDGLAAAKAALAATPAATPLLALNAVGGDSALRLMDLLDKGGTHVTYGAMARQALKVPNSMLIFKGLTLRGFWLTLWKAEQSPAALTQLYDHLIDLTLTGKLHQQIAATYPLASFRDALTHAAQNSRNGKILLQF